MKYITINMKKALQDMIESCFIQIELNSLILQQTQIQGKQEQEHASKEKDSI